MNGINRRRWLAGAGATLAAAHAAQAADGREGRMYDYLFLDFDAEPGGRPAAAYADQVRGRKSAIEAAGGQVLGLFTPQLGWHAGQAALLVGWNSLATARETLVGELSKLPGVASVKRERLDATARPGPADRPRAGGIYVHRWFVIATPTLDEVVALSTQGWRDFEDKFDTNIFGLFKAAPSDEDTAGGLTRLLLITRYGGHGIWETSRDPSTEAMAAFARRQKLTRDTWAAST
ncbi:MAG: hypothetical protein U1C74_12945, partial [Phenylobacterium sp.]|nr:hypothetical protein [Phenylobacterium sp.]